MAFKKQQIDFAKAVASIELFFPDDEVCCKNCFLFGRYEDNYKRFTCRYTGELIVSPINTIGAKCIWTFINKEGEILDG